MIIIIIIIVVVVIIIIIIIIIISTVIFFSFFKFWIQFCSFDICHPLQTKCEKYWPETTSKYGSVTVSLQKTETFADYIIRTFTLLKVSLYQ